MILKILLLIAGYLLIGGGVAGVCDIDDNQDFWHISIFWPLIVLVMIAGVGYIGVRFIVEWFKYKNNEEK